MNLVAEAEKRFTETGSPSKNITGAQYQAANRRERFVAWMDSQVGVDEDRGANDSAEIDVYLTTAGLDKNKPYAWCAVLVYWCCLKAGYKSNELPDKGKCAATHQWQKWSVLRGFAINGPERGAVGGWVNKDLTGHTYCYLSGWLSSSGVQPYARTIEGNTNDGGSREGELCAKRERKKSLVMGMHKPFFVRLPA